MRYIQIFVALLALSLIVLPAVSAKDNGNAVDDNKNPGQMAACPHQCDSKAPQGSMNLPGQPQSVMDEKMCGQPDKNPCDEKPEAAQQPAPRSMMDGKMCGQPDKNPCDEKPEAAQQPAPRSMMEKAVAK
ncbi:MAG: hypothetical protein KBI12_01265 [Methanothrix sp.]|nr:hypothetical protein [Methanothrix sp.]